MHADHLPTHCPDGTRVVPLYGLRVCAALGPEGASTFAFTFDNFDAVNRIELVDVLEGLKHELLADTLSGLGRDLHA